MAKDSHEDVANLTISGESVRVGYYRHDIKSFYIQVGDAEQPTYMTIWEADLLIASLQAAKAEAKAGS